MLCVVAIIFSRKAAKNAKFSSFFCDFAASLAPPARAGVREAFDEGQFENHKFR